MRRLKPGQTPRGNKERIIVSPFNTVFRDANKPLPDNKGWRITMGYVKPRIAVKNAMGRYASRKAPIRKDIVLSKETPGRMKMTAVLTHPSGRAADFRRIQDVLQSKGYSARRARVPDTVPRYVLKVSKNGKPMESRSEINELTRMLSGKLKDPRFDYLVWKRDPRLN